MKKNVIETLIGAVVILIAGGFLFFAYGSVRVDTSDGYKLVAKFDRIDGLIIGSDVRVSGIKIGSISKQTIDQKTYQAVVEMIVKNEIKLPKDSTAEIVSDGLLGSKYLALVPGGDNAMLKNGDQITYTQSSVSIESLIGKFMFSGDENKKEETPENKSETLSPKL